MERLLEGYRRFRSGVWPIERRRYEILAAEGQRPETMVIACSDSRVDPDTVFDAGPGELFVVRNVAGLVPPYRPDAEYHVTSAALEFGARVLKVSRVVVLGHAQCGGVQAMVQGAPAEAPDFVASWMSIARPALQQARLKSAEGGDIIRHCEAEVVRLSLANLLTFPWIAQAVGDGRLQLHGFLFGIHDGDLTRVEKDRLVPVE